MIGLVQVCLQLQTMMWHMIVLFAHCSSYIDQYVSKHSITSKVSSPPFIIPLLKALLRIRNKRFKKLHTHPELNSKLTYKIGRLVGEHHCNLPANCDHKSIKKLWDCVQMTLDCKSKDNKKSKWSAYQFRWCECMLC